MPHRALAITSTRHATALTLYGALAFIGALHVTDLAPHVPVTDTIGDTGAALWALLFVIGPLAALTAALVAPSVRVPVIPMWIEGAGCIVAASAATTYAWCMFQFYGFTPAATIEVIFGGIACGLLARFQQITREQGRIRKARAHPQPASPPPLAEADSRG